MGKNTLKNKHMDQVISIATQTNLTIDFIYAATVGLSDKAIGTLLDNIAALPDGFYVSTPEDMD